MRSQRAKEKAGRRLAKKGSKKRLIQRRSDRLGKRAHQDVFRAGSKGTPSKGQEKVYRRLAKNA
jgi:hypothetical protein